MQSPDSESSGSTTSHDVPFESIQSLKPPSSHIQTHRYTSNNAETTSEDDGSSEEETEDDEAREFRALQSRIDPHRPHSSSSVHRYRTPITGSLLSQTPTGGSGVPAIQPLPPFETPSAFPAPASSTPGSVYNPVALGSRDTSHLEPTRPEGHHFRPHSQPALPPIQIGPHSGPVRAASRVTLERAVENVQAHLAALTERLEVLESRSLHNSASSSYRGSPQRASHNHENSLSGSGRLPGRGSPHPTWDLDDLGMWSYILNPISSTLSFLHKLARFFASDGNRSPAKVIIRRLCLDLSFLVCVITIVGAVWKKSGVRRREVKAALIVLWRAIVGNRTPRSLSDRGV